MLRVISLVGARSTSSSLLRCFSITSNKSNNINKIMKTIFSQGVVTKGFGRGSKDLGIPTANFSEDVVSGLPSDFPTGIYHGWARVDDGPVYKMVMSIGWNPFFKNEKKSMETHILHKFDDDFYGSWLRVIICGYIRPEENYSSLDELIKAIHGDIAQAEKELSEKSEFKVLKDEAFITGPADKTSENSRSKEDL